MAQFPVMGSVGAQPPNTLAVLNFAKVYLLDNFERKDVPDAKGPFKLETAMGHALGPVSGRLYVVFKNMTGRTTLVTATADGEQRGYRVDNPALDKETIREIYAVDVSFDERAIVIAVGGGLYCASIIPDMPLDAAPELAFVFRPFIGPALSASYDRFSSKLFTVEWPTDGPSEGVEKGLCACLYRLDGPTLTLTPAHTVFRRANFMSDYIRDHADMAFPTLFLMPGGRIAICWGFKTVQFVRTDPPFDIVSLRRVIHNTDIVDLIALRSGSLVVRVGRDRQLSTKNGTFVLDAHGKFWLVSTVPTRIAHRPMDHAVVGSEDTVLIPNRSGEEAALSGSYRTPELVVYRTHERPALPSLHNLGNTEFINRFSGQDRYHPLLQDEYLGKIGALLMAWLYAQSRNADMDPQALNALRFTRDHAIRLVCLAVLAANMDWALQSQLVRQFEVLF